jgi:cellulose synthase/poly-beta-1,6-N-acetylglucosamine synthase-like glycosyltransferase
MIVLEIIFILLLAVLSVPVAVFAIQVVSALPPRKATTLPRGPRPSIAILVPAHDEAEGIGATLNSLREQLHSGDRIVVVADNCSDNTAAVARAAGAEAIERSDAVRRGKGYALDFGVRHLESWPPEVVIIVDADCVVDAGALDRLAHMCIAKGRPVQALYLMHAPAGTGLKTKIAEFAWTVKNLARPLGFHHLGLPCQLMGTGMAFPWQLIQRTELASGHIVEDLKIGLDCARAGLAPLFCPEAVVHSVFPANVEGEQSQRTRWEHGHLGIIFKDAPRLLLESLRTMNLGLFSLVLDVSVPPLALLTLLVFALCLLGALLWGATGAGVPWGLAWIEFAVLGSSVLLAWGRFGRGILSFANLAYAPVYALRKIPLYLNFIVRRQIDWVRSRRDEP